MAVASAIDDARAQRDGGEPVAGMVAPQRLFRRPLALAVGPRRLLQAVLADGRLGAAVDGDGAEVHEAAQPGRGAGRQQALRRLHVHGPEVAVPPADLYHPGAVDDDVGAADGPGQVHRGGQVAAMDLDPAPPQLLRGGCLANQGPHRVAAGQQPVDHVASDQARGPGHQVTHASVWWGTKAGAAHAGGDDTRASEFGGAPWRGAPGESRVRARAERWPPAQDPAPGRARSG